MNHQYWEIYDKQQKINNESKTGIPNPPGFSVQSKKGMPGKVKSSIVGEQRDVSEIRDELKVKKAWEIAIAPAKQLPMTAFMMYMSGNTVQIFSMMMTFMMFFNPVQALTTVSAHFSPLQDKNTRTRLILPRLVFILLQVAGIGLGVWKAASMGLLPTSSSDWLAWEQVPEPLEQSILLN
ncbi:ER membrane protein complex subunit 4 isoform B [Neolecta irregularis DAH-3]|uniref:ER membrane protein complex subunit 4 n=1 Tax=Neolecta irregularis (strain DAH-3) TaxID=1198029 RepID=A0A1U7LNS7_NEOID|nr:ER membrane protein complex subunit 4 isoform A [Neolecta irregularis DAH-3]OLL24243.1 ER membrane protein complex subunit 4 isoform B [Neolecta irregularis DAH-3]|eukprot:OLL24242.1 ER membrane protein complex subunit 4 isoform A [Neolecta irregularis DAH-3]